ncbi:MAG TPA: winged helix DNA-binding domain-containing protein [Anaerolineales bacterium]
MISFSDDETRRLRLQAQRLLPGEGGKDAGAAQVVQALCGLQAQEAGAAVLGVRARSTGLLAKDVEHARVEERSLVRTWGPRGTLHLLAAADLGWLVALLGPLFVAKNQRRYRELGLDEETIARGIQVIRKTLSSRGPLARAEIGRELAKEGIPTEGQALIHLIGRAALEGYVCLGPDQGSQPSYVLVEDWIDVDPAPSGEAALAELARRYLEAYGPAGPADLAAWSGLGTGEARRAWELISQDRVEVQAAGRPAWMLAERLDAQPAGLEAQRDRSPSVRLLPRYDTYLLGYAGRELAVPPEHARRINAGGGIIHAAVLVDGRALGTWRIEKKRDRLEILVDPFEALDPLLLPELETEAEDIGRFYGLETGLQILPPGLS